MHCVIPLFAARRPRSATQPGESRVVGGDHAGAAASLDGHVAEGHARLHRHGPNSAAGILDGITRAPRGADPRDHRQDRILGRDMRAEPAVDDDPHLPRLALPQSLGGQDMSRLGRADPEGQGAECAVRRGVGIAADQRDAGQGQALLGADNMHDPLPRIAHPHDVEAMALAVLGQMIHQASPVRVLDRPGARVAGDVVVGHAKGQVRPAHRAPIPVQNAEGVEAAVMHQMPVDPQQMRAVIARDDDMRIPDFVEQGQRLGHRCKIGVSRSDCKPSGEGRKPWGSAPNPARALPFDPTKAGPWMPFIG